MSRLSILAAAIAAAVTLAAAAAGAQPAPPRPAGPPGAGTGPPDPSYVQAQLDSLHQRLKLAAEQEPAWQAFTDAVMQQARDFRDRPVATPAATAPAPERFAFMAQMARRSADALDAAARSMQTLYDALGPEQRAIVDREFAPRPPPGAPLR